MEIAGQSSLQATSSLLDIRKEQSKEGRAADCFVYKLLNILLLHEYLTHPFSIQSDRK